MAIKIPFDRAQLGGEDCALIPGPTFPSAPHLAAHLRAWCRALARMGWPAHSPAPVRA